MSQDPKRRTLIKGVAATAAAAALPKRARAAGGKGPIVIGLPTSQTAAHGVADDQDHLNGTILAMEEINAAGGILGRELRLEVVDTDKLSPEACAASVRALVDKKVHAISNAFLFVPIPAMDASVKWACPYLNGNTQRAATEAFRANPVKYSHIFQVDPSEVHYGYHFPIWLKAMKDQGVWEPANNGIHIVQEQVAYNQTISRACQEAIKRQDTFELAGITDIQYPVQNWGPVVEQIRKVGAGAVMIDHWVAAEFAAFCKQFRARPLKNSLVYLQYGPSQPEFLDLARGAAEGFCWSTVMGIYADEAGLAYREKYKKRFPGTMGVVYTGIGYDIVYYLKAAWEAVGDPSDFKAVCDWIRVNPYDGLCGHIDMNNEYQEAAHWPDNGYDVRAPSLDKGVSQLYYQVQQRQHRIIYPYELKEVTLKPAPWWS
ncbi:MAG: ABC transporter substrate-binding protein [Gammaproteobacteria bacterium]